MSARPTRRTADTGDGSAYTTKEVLLQVQAELRGFVSAHEARHGVEAQSDTSARSEASATAAGRALLAAQTELAKDISELSRTVQSHERTIQRLVGAMALVVFLGGGAFIVAALSAAGRLLNIPGLP